ncbi:hypothetical protein [Coleofasciculus sp.]|uniref:hypothetical protein n=1 Tax=Coleofasciculus sp. TaxID=3100458 RepID=UPI0039F768CC
MLQERYELCLTAKQRETIESNMLKQVAILMAIVATQTTYSLMARSQVVDRRSQYQETNVADFIQRNNINDMNPRSLAGQLLSRPESLEGRQQEDIMINYALNRTEDPTIVEYTTIGLADDSVRSKRTRIELKWQQNGWQITWVGSQFQCHSGRGHQDWSKELCY